jgi:hypothetical protein
MSDPLRKVSPGESPARLLNAQTFNLTMDAAAWVRRHGQAALGRMGAVGAINPDQLAGRLEVRVQAATSLPQFGIISLGAPVIDADAAPINAFNTPVFAATTPTETEVLAILAEPLSSGKIGRAVIMGVAVCDVEVTDVTHKFARPVGGSVFALESAVAGPVRLLETAGGTGTVGMLVLLQCLCRTSGPEPDEPTSLAAAAPVDDTVELTWTEPASGEPAQYVIYISGDAAFTQYTVAALLPGDTTPLEYTLTDLADGTYYVAVAALSAGGVESSWSAVETFTISPVTEYTTPGSHTFTPPATGNYLVECLGSGAGGATAMAPGAAGGGGGGGAYAASTVALTSGVGKGVVVGAGGAANLAGGNTTFDTTVVVAVTGQPGSGGNGGAGGTAAASTGTTKFSGGSGANAAAGTPGGAGSSAGTASNGGNGSGSTGGTAPAGGGDGGSGGTGGGAGSAGSAPGGGGGGGDDAAGAGGAGGAGKVRITGPL